MRTPDIRQFKPIGNAAVFIRDSRDDVEALHVYGEVDMARESDFEKAIEDVAGLKKPILIDLTYCTYVDSRAIHVLQKASTKYQLRVRVASDSAVQRIFEILHAGEFLNVSYECVSRPEPRNVHR